MSRFTLFSRLPQELQDEVWDAAIRDDGPAAHFFTIYDVVRDDPSSVVPTEKRIVPTRGINSLRCPRPLLGLAAPRSSDDSRQSWIDRNESAYMIDSGLWTACWESRQRMLKRFPLTVLPPPAGAHPPAGVPAGIAPLSLNRTPLTMPFLSDNGERQYLTIRPYDDLLCFQFARGSHFAVDSDSHWDYMQGLPLFMGWWVPRARWWCPGLVRHVAVEFSPALEQSARQVFHFRTPGANLLDALEVRGLDRFWFISHTLERRYRADEDRSSRRRFRAAGGMELVEVLDGDGEWRDPSVWQPPLYRCFPGLSAAHDLVCDLERLRMFLRPPWAHVNTDASPHLPPRFGVLACVRPGTERDLPTESEWLAENPGATSSPGSGNT